MTRPYAVGASALLTCAEPAPAGLVADAVVAWERDSLLFAGPRSGWDGPIDETFDGCTIVPGFVDCHTHLPFVGWRQDEHEARLAGATYRDLHGTGGIPRSARMLAEASDDEVLEFSRAIAAEMLAHGTTALELKTGYGLSVEGELRQAGLARRLAGSIPQTAVVTLLACHAVPQGSSREEWVWTACRELIPAATAEGLAQAVDVYVEDIAFTVEDLELVAEAAAANGLALRCHADQLGHSAAAEAAVRLGARSADHLNHTGAEGVRALGSGETTAVLLPASTLMLRATPPPVDALRRAGATLAIATDCNPGTSPVASMPEAAALACALYGLSPAEALVAATRNPARVLGLRAGELAPGLRADLAIVEGIGFGMVPYRPGHNPVKAVVVGGEPVSRSA